MPCHLCSTNAWCSDSWVLQNSLGYESEEVSVVLIGNQIEDPVDELDKDKSGEGVVMYEFIFIYEMGSIDDERFPIILVIYLRAKPHWTGHL